MSERSGLCDEAAHQEEARALAGLGTSVERVHFVGIGGIGMSAVAEVMHGLGYTVSGSDLRPSALTARLRTLGMTVDTPHHAGLLADADLLVRSAAIPDDNPEVGAARRRGVPVVRRGAMLAALTRGHSLIAVTGTHGKSTTSSMVAVMLAECGVDPSVVVGARVPAFGSNARVGRGRHFVVEADESEPSLLALRPRIAVVTNLEEEHLDTYGSFEALEETVTSFANRVPPDGTVVVCADDPVLGHLRARLQAPQVGYGLDAEDADVRGDDVQLDAEGSRCRVLCAAALHPEPIDLEIGVPGRHNLLNALGALTVGLTLGLPVARMRSALRDFGGVDRRFQLKGEVGNVRVVDDYAHHPTEVAAVLATARCQPHDRLIVVLQPHRYSRVRRLMDGFADALSDADLVVLTEVYAAGEPAEPEATLERLVAKVAERSRGPVHAAPTLDDAVALTCELVRAGDLVLTLGAGSIGGAGDRILERLREDAGQAGPVRDGR